MSLRTLERDAPSSFKHSVAAGTRALLLCALAVVLMLADVRFKLTEPVRQAVSAVLFPIQWAVMQPVEWLGGAKNYFQDLGQAQEEAAEARRLMAAMSLKAYDAEKLLAENQQLRDLLELRPRLVVDSVAAEVMYESPDSYTRRVVLDKGQVAGIVAGSLPVARVVEVERRLQSSFMRVYCEPMARLDGARHVVVLTPLNAIKAEHVPDAHELAAEPQTAAQNQREDKSAQRRTVPAGVQPAGVKP